MLALVLLLALLGATRAQQCDESPLEVPGDAVITALLPLGLRPACAAPVPRGLRLAAAAVQVLGTLSRLQPVPAVDIGLRILDSCNSADVARKALLASFAQLDCLHLYPLGVLAGAEVSQAQPVSTLCAGLGQALWTLPESQAPEPQLAEALGALLAAGGWPAADILTSSVHDDEGDEDPDGDAEHHLDAAEVLGDAAAEAARRRSVCVRRGHSPDGFQWGGPPSRALVLTGIEAALRRMLRDQVLTQQVDAEPGTWPQLLLVPPDGVWTGTPLPRGALLLLPDVAPVQEVLQRLLDTNATLEEDDGAPPLRPEGVASHVGLDDFLDVGRAILEASDLLKAGVDALCAMEGEGTKEETSASADPDVDVEAQNETLPAAAAYSSSSGSSGLCGHLPPPGKLRQELGVARKGRQLSDDELMTLLEVRSDEVLSRIPTTVAFSLFRSPGPGRTLALVAHYKNSQWTVLDESVLQAGAGAGAVDCPSLLADGLVEWVREAWVATLLTVAALGTLCASAVAFFIASRILAGDVLEGSATLSLLLLLGVLLGYAGALPYCVRPSGASRASSRALPLCALRLLAAPLAHGLQLGVMLARAVMLAACDHEGGLLSHVSGPLQGALCFFAVSVQVALSLQLGLVVSPALCAALAGPRFLLLLAYDSLLLVLLAATTPFIFTSRRNYREGGFFTLTTAALLVVWSCWVTLFLVGGHAWRDAAVASGLAVGSTVVLLGVFIPRTYMMAGAMVRDKLAAQLPALARDNGITELAFREAAAGRCALYDCQTASEALGPGAGPNLGFLPPPPPRVPASPNPYAARARPSTPRTSEGTYERYDVPSPLKVTRF